MARQRSRRSMALAAFAAAAGFTAGASGLDTPGPTSIDELVARLGADSFPQREAATLELSQRTEIPIADVERALANPALTLEQRTRLIEAARAKFYAAPRAALGVQFDSLQPSRAVISKTFPAFPAAAMLQPGDEIIRVGDQSVTEEGWGVVRPKILSRDPGQSLDMTIRRNGEDLRLAVPLGKFTDLPQARMDSWDLQAAWLERRAAFEPTAAPIRIAGADEPWERDFAARQPGFNTRAFSHTPLLAVGGEPRGGQTIHDADDGAAASDIVPGAAPNGPVVVRQELWINGQRVPIQQGQGGVVVQIGPNGQQVIRQQPPQRQAQADPRLIGEYQRLTSSRAQLETEIMVLTQRLANPALKPDERQAVVQALAGRQQALLDADRRIARVEALLRLDAQMPRR
ncbi:MAG: PDZ domain-containing protein [Phycisphaerae bacterium]|nr:PDZ domain-containing protein [Phycisphaerae bacterium]